MWLWLVQLLGGLLGFLVQWFTKRTIVALGIVAAVVALTVALLIAIKSIVSGISYSLPDGITQACSWVLPSNTYVCLSAVFVSRALKWAWQWQVHFIEMYNKG